MKRISPTTLISLGLACLALTILLTAQSLGLVPDPARAVCDARIKLCEMTAAQCSVAANSGDLEMAGAVLRAAAARDPEVISAGIRTADHKLLYAYGPHEQAWGGSGVNAASEISTPTHIHVPIYQREARWGSVEFCFRPLGKPGLSGYLSQPLVRLIAFAVLAMFLGFMLYLKRVMRHLDPSAVIPPRVRVILDALAEGVVVLDRDERIVLANEAFAAATGQSIGELLGRKPSELPWVPPSDAGASPSNYPWQAALGDGQIRKGVPLRLQNGAQQQTFMVNAAPILGLDKSRRGAMATFDDVTSVESTNEQLRIARDEVARQNQELELLASRDPLTGCLNRRSFLKSLEEYWTAARQSGGALACVMVDVDHFKSVNDRFGHAAGDQVLRDVAQLLTSAARGQDLVCRYGGEEFCIVLPATELEEATSFAQQLRGQIERHAWPLTSITASLGASALELNPPGPRELLSQADEALYVAKRRGRNRVVRADQVRGPSPGETGAPTERRVEDRIFPQVVDALVASLSHRDRRTAEHCKRVADLCVAVGSHVMPAWDARVLEFGALLHDIGKLGTPDAVLLKPGPLTEEEWKVMRAHERHGIEIISAGFNHQALTDIVGLHHAWFGGHPDHPEMPRGQSIPLGARILAIADAFDAIVSDRVYRKGRSAPEAFVELRRCAGTQFDPQLVEQFIEVVQRQQPASGQESSDRNAQRVEAELRDLDSRSQRDADEAVARATHELAELSKLPDGSTPVRLPSTPVGHSH